MMRVLVGCEFSGVVRRAFRERGHDAWSCDLLPAEDESEFHIQGDVLEVINGGWDMMIAHPPCTHIAVSGAAHFSRKRELQEEALEFVRKLMRSKIPRKALENPVSVISTRIRPPDQIIHPWQFGHKEQKTTCLWLWNLPPLTPTHIVYDAMMLLPKRERERETALFVAVARPRQTAFRNVCGNR